MREKRLVKVFSNAPLPESFAGEAVLSPDGSEFALRPDTSKLFIDWCLEKNIEVTGFDVWLQGPTDHTALDRFSFRGDRRSCLREIDCVLNHVDVLSFNRDILFNVWVNYQES